MIKPELNWLQRPTRLVQKIASRLKDKVPLPSGLFTDLKGYEMDPRYANPKPSMA